VSELIAIEELRTYLVAQGVVRNWGDAANGLPQCILAPRDGAPEAQGQAYQDGVVTLAKIGQQPPVVQEEFLEAALVECVTRAYRAVDAELIQRRVRAKLNGLRLFTMGSLIVEHAQVFAGDQPLGSDETSYTRMQTFLIQTRVKSLAGTPYALGPEP
jgi:hypothetical protein